MLEVISWFVDDDSLSLAQDFLKAISQYDDDSAWALAHKLLPNLKEANRRYALELILHIEDVSTDTVIAQALIKQILEQVQTLTENPTEAQLKHLD